jgi:REP element-mobilizing transposase RayT
MASTLYAHLTWTTLRRSPLIDAKVAAFLRSFLPPQAHRYGGQVLQLGIVRTHVHVVLSLAPNCRVPELVQGLKGASARVANRDGVAPADRPLRWDRGYDLRSVSPRALAAVSNYVRDQGERHPLDRIQETSGPQQAPVTWNDADRVVGP